MRIGDQMFSSGKKSTPGSKKSTPNYSVSSAGKHSLNRQSPQQQYQQRPKACIIGSKVASDRQTYFLVKYDNSFTPRWEDKATLESSSTYRNLIEKYERQQLEIHGRRRKRQNRQNNHNRNTAINFNSTSEEDEEVSDDGDDQQQHHHQQQQQLHRQQQERRNQQRRRQQQQQQELLDQEDDDESSFYGEPINLKRKSYQIGTRAPSASLPTSTSKKICKESSPDQLDSDQDQQQQQQQKHYKSVSPSVKNTAIFALDAALDQLKPKYKKEKSKMEMRLARLCDDFENNPRPKQSPSPAQIQQSNKQSNFTTPPQKQLYYNENNNNNNNHANRNNNIIYKQLSTSANRQKPSASPISKQSDYEYSPTPSEKYQRSLVPGAVMPSPQSILKRPIQQSTSVEKIKPEPVLARFHNVATASSMLPKPPSTKKVSPISKTGNPLVSPSRLFSPMADISPSKSRFVEVRPSRANQNRTFQMNRSPQKLMKSSTRKLAAYTIDRMASAKASADRIRDFYKNKDRLLSEFDQPDTLSESGLSRMNKRPAPWSASKHVELPTAVPREDLIANARKEERERQFMKKDFASYLEKTFTSARMPSPVPVVVASDIPLIKPAVPVGPSVSSAFQSMGIQLELMNAQSALKELEFLQSQSQQLSQSIMQSQSVFDSQMSHGGINPHIKPLKDLLKNNFDRMYEIINKRKWVLSSTTAGQALAKTMQRRKDSEILGASGAEDNNKNNDRDYDDDIASSKATSQQQVQSQQKMEQIHDLLHLSQSFIENSTHFLQDNQYNRRKFLDSHELLRDDDDDNEEEKDDEFGLLHNRPQSPIKSDIFDDEDIDYLQMQVINYLQSQASQELLHNHPYQALEGQDNQIFDVALETQQVVEASKKQAEVVVAEETKNVVNEQNKDDIDDLPSPVIEEQTIVKVAAAKATTTVPQSEKSNELEAIEKEKIVEEEEEDEILDDIEFEEATLIGEMKVPEVAEEVALNKEDEKAVVADATDSKVDGKEQENKKDDKMDVEDEHEEQLYDVAEIEKQHFSQKVPAISQEEEDTMDTLGKKSQDTSEQMANEDAPSEVNESTVIAKSDENTSNVVLNEAVITEEVLEKEDKVVLENKESKDQQVEEKELPINGHFDIGDVARRIVTCRPVESEIFVDIEWEARKDGFVPKKSTINSKIVREFNHGILLDFYESKIKFTQNAALAKKAAAAAAATAVVAQAAAPVQPSSGDVQAS